MTKINTRLIRYAYKHKNAIGTIAMPVVVVDRVKDSIVPYLQTDATVKDINASQNDLTTFELKTD